MAEKRNFGYFGHFGLQKIFLSCKNNSLKFCVVIPISSKNLGGTSLNRCGDRPKSSAQGQVYRYRPPFSLFILPTLTVSHFQDIQCTFHKLGDLCMLMSGKKYLEYHVSLTMFRLTNKQNFTFKSRKCQKWLKRYTWTRTG